MKIEAKTLGEAWIAIAAAILKDGVAGSWEGLPMVEVFRASLEIESPAADDPVIARHGDPERLAWMRANFTDRTRVAELGDSDSYATRLFDTRTAAATRSAGSSIGSRRIRRPARRPSRLSSR